MNIDRALAIVQAWHKEAESNNDGSPETTTRCEVLSRIIVLLLEKDEKVA